MGIANPPSPLPRLAARNAVYSWPLSVSQPDRRLVSLLGYGDVHFISSHVAGRHDKGPKGRAPLLDPPSKETDNFPPLNVAFSPIGLPSETGPVWLSPKTKPNELNDRERGKPIVDSGRFCFGVRGVPVPFVVIGATIGLSVGLETSLALPSKLGDSRCDVEGCALHSRFTLLQGRYRTFSFKCLASCFVPWSPPEHSRKREEAPLGNCPYFHRGV